MRTLIFSAVAVIFFSLPVLAQAQGGVAPVPVPTTVDIPQLITTVLNWAFGLLLVLAAAFILYAGFLYLMGGTNEENIGKAKNYILYAVIAIVIGFLARGIVAIVRGLLGT